MAMVFMAGLKRLHFSMKRVGTERARFSIKHNQVTFDCLFLTDLEPYEFVLAAVGHPGIVFVLEVLNGYFVKGVFAHELYAKLAGLLGTGARSGNKLIPSEFLQQIDAAIPADVAGTLRVTTADVLGAYRHHVEEDQKIYFKGWLRNPPGKHVTAANLDKTRRCFGQKVYEICMRHNISSCWSSNPSDEVAFSVPKTA